MHDKHGQIHVSPTNQRTLLLIVVFNVNAQRQSNAYRQKYITQMILANIIVQDTSKGL